MYFILFPLLDLNNAFLQFIKWKRLMPWCLVYLFDIKDGDYTRDCFPEIQETIQMFHIFHGCESSWDFQIYIPKFAFEWTSQEKVYVYCYLKKIVFFLFPVLDLNNAFLQFIKWKRLLPWCFVYLFDIFPSLLSNEILRKKFIFIVY